MTDRTSYGQNIDIHSWTLWGAQVIKLSLCTSAVERANGSVGVRFKFIRTSGP